MINSQIYEIDNIEKYSIRLSLRNPPKNGLAPKNLIHMSLFLQGGLVVIVYVYAVFIGELE